MAAGVAPGRPSRTFAGLAAGVAALGLAGAGLVVELLLGGRHVPWLPAASLALALVGAVLVAGWAGRLRRRMQAELLRQHQAEREAAEQRLRRTEERLRLLAENARDVIFRYRLRPDRGMDYVSPSVQALSGRPAERFYAEPEAALRIIHPDDLPSVEAMMAGQGGAYHVRWLRPDGSVVYTDQMISVVRDGAGEVVAVEGIARDVTERRRMERALQRSEERVKLALAASGASAVDWDLQGGDLHLGAEWRALLDAPPDGLWLAPDLEGAGGFVHPDDRPALREKVAALLEGRARLLESTHRACPAAGGVRWVELRGQVVERDGSERPLRFAGTLRDVTEQRELSARLALADRLASVGTLAAGVAHEVNNPLSYLTANLAFLRGKLDAMGQEQGLPPQLAECREAMGEAIDGAARVQEVVKGLLRFGRTGAAVRGPVDLRREIEAAVRITRHEIAHRARLTLELEPVPEVEAAEHELGQVLVNLLLNAAQAIAPGSAADNAVLVTSRTDGDGRAVVAVRDTGCGIAPEHLARIFDPFFTTKPAGQGTGLGLAICHRIVGELGGTLEVESQPGRGALFRLVLPPARAAKAERPASAPAAPAARARLLVVDDEPMVGRAIVRLLRGMHDVEAESSPLAALERVARGERWDAVLCDLMMPELDGVAFAARVARDAPGLAQRIIFMTGGAFTDVTREFLAADGRVHLEKPIDTEALQAALAAVVHATPPGE